MARSPEHVIVVGAGMVGLSTAWFLQAEGARVTVVDRAGVAAGSSWGNAGWLAPALTHPLPDPAILAGGIKAMLKSSSPVYVPVTANPRLLAFLLDFARHCTPARWRSAMTVFAEANRQSFEAFDEIAAGGLGEPTRTADPFVAAFVSGDARRGLLEELEHVQALGVDTPVELLDDAQMHALVPALGAAVTCGVRLVDQVHQPRAIRQRTG